MLQRKVVRQGREVGRLTDDAALGRAFRLAHSIYRHDERLRGVALKVVSEALSAVEVRLTAQIEADRHEPQRPSKVRWNTVQWFQMMIFYKSEAYETQQEAGRDFSLTQEDMMIRYVKHLVLTTCRRNSFHVSLGLSRLLYGYSAAEATAIYDLVFQDPDNSTKKVDAYYRARKNVLIEELRRRFQRFLRIEEGPRGEKRFQLQPDSLKFGELVFQYLARFTPWETRCELPRQLDTWATLASLQSSQANQIHALIHPACFSRITEALKLDPPRTRLALPRFFFASASSPDDSPPSDLTGEEIAELRRRLDDEEERRKKFTPSSLRVLVDGVERARLNLAESSEIRFDLEAEATLIEMVGRAGEHEALLASHMVTYEEDESQPAQPEEYSIVLEGGQKISLTIRPERSGDRLAQSVQVKYQETRAARAFVLWSKQFGRRLFGAGLVKTWRGVPVPSPAAIALLALIAAGVALYLTLRRSGTEERIAKLQPPPPVVKVTETPSLSPSPQPRATPERTPPPPPSRQPGPPAREQHTPPDTTTREQTERAVKSLADVRQVYVESFGEDPFGQSVRQKLIEKLRGGHDFVITNSPDDADTAIKGSARTAGQSPMNAGQESQVGEVQITLVNVDGDVIWQAKRYRGTSSSVADQFAKDLYAAIEAEKQRREQR
jgi:hypothetical protein